MTLNKLGTFLIFKIFFKTFVGFIAIPNTNLNNNVKWKENFMINLSFHFY